MEFIDSFSTTITKPIFIILNNTSVHPGDRMEKSLDKWRQWRLYIFFPSLIFAPFQCSKGLVESSQNQKIKLSYYIDTHTLCDAKHRTRDDIRHDYVVNY